LGCSPKYKIVYDFIPPASKKSQDYIKKCYQDLKECNKECENKKQDCYQKALLEANKEYKKKIELYEKKLKIYNEQYSKYLSFKAKENDLIEKITYYTNICDEKKDKYACELGLKYQYQLEKLKHLKEPIKPREPSLDMIIAQKKSSMCLSECPCDEQFRRCYVSAGGTVIAKKICIANCDE